MIISYHNHEFFKVQFGDTILAFNPISKESKIKGARFGADVALVSLNHQDFNGVDNVTFGERAPVVISGPGEYEVKGVFVRGFPVKTVYEKEEKIATLHLVNLEGMNLCFVGPIKSRELDKNITAALDEIDILFVPIGGEDVLSPADAYKLAVALEPKLIIPMHYDENGGKAALKAFFKEGGEGEVKPIDKLTLKRKDLEGKEGEIVVLAPQV